MKTALITGASRGIGAAIARLLAQNNYKVIITCAQDENSLLNVRDEINKEAANKETSLCEAYICDMGDYTAVTKLFDKLPEIDVLINNAGISYFGLLSDMSYEDWRRVMSANLDSLFNTCKAAIGPMVRKKEGKIINISSVWGSAGSSLEVAYSTSKGGVNAFTKALAKELAPSNIQVNAIAPGMIDTAMNACLTKEDVTSIIEEIPADRIGRPEEVAELCLKILEAPDYMTGQIISIDGGWV